MDKLATLLIAHSLATPMQDSVVVQSSSVDITWQAPTNYFNNLPIKGYIVYTNNNLLSPFGIYTQVDANTFQVTKLRDSQQFYFHVVSTNELGLQSK